ncbi:MAG: F0F1 ATP synthase subunit delta [Pelagibacteraceae bacterium]|nr:F0F1 ATP synthase subunit delta [Pelagibacteraceae bacterium]
MNEKQAKFSIGDIVKHKYFNFRGVIYDVDFEFNNSEEWYRSIPKNVRPRKDQPFYHLLAENKRLSLLPEISTLFEVLKANQEKSVDVEITTAFEISSDISSKLETALKTRLQREIRLATRVNQNLIGGAVIRAGDTVIDNSIRGKLSKLAESMNS